MSSHDLRNYFSILIVDKHGVLTNNYEFHSNIETLHWEQNIALNKLILESCIISGISGISGVNSAGWILMMKS